ncbi:hypothetical protein ALC56_06305 [Trachymyrmex septentrionalis]|uniref:DNA-directed DNA polymerase n=1 Tax=Trachymyrmex septentrionalis TaxID=34720 RepID=A0A151JXA1_9HYME|nr:hypothetical protein ALC56_06305 [Trachymyrmex septentrionalis]
MKNHERVERELKQCGQIAILMECFAWLQRCDECNERLEELYAAFESRILTGAVINVDYIEPRRFLEDARKIVLERVRDAVERHGSAKVNAGIEFPMILKDISKFERLNAVSINVCVYTASRINKFLYMKDPRNDGVGHFTWIKNLLRLVRSQITRNKNKKFFCDRCVHYFSTNEKLQLHVLDCRKINDCVIRLPSLNEKWLEFGNHCNKERVPFIVYADLECVIPIVFHNLSGYDAHFIIKEIATAYEEHVDVLSKNGHLSIDVIELNTNFRTFEKNLYELMNNAVVYTISESKIALSPYDDKRYVVPNSTKTLPWGHWRIPS